MSKTASDLFRERGSAADVEGGADFAPLFDRDGLIAAIVTDAESGEVLMFAYMNRAALGETIKTRSAHFWSRSRQRLWRKGEESGNTLEVEDMRIDCDQDVLWLRVRIKGDGVACHTGARSCFYRSVPLGEAAGGALRPVAMQRAGINRKP